MRPQEVDYIKHRFMRAQQTLDEADHLFKGGFTIGVVNRIYYACFYAVSALLMAEGYASSKHSGVMTLFDKFWIKTGQLPEDVGTFYHTMFDKRHKGDYDELPVIERSDVETWLATASSFVEQARAWLSEHEGLDC